jgi:signal transduction histidine kinase/DNA-binding response OmpR family regulator
VSLPEPPPSSPTAEILLVDDDSKTLLAMEAMLAEVGGTLVTARSGREALLKLLTQDFAVILLDVQMPDLDGFETAELIRERDKSRHTPIIFLTAFNQNDRAMLRGYALGAVDFMFKPIVPEILRSKVQVFVELQRKTLEVRRQARLIREAEAREHARVLGEERQRWEADNLRAQMERERAATAELARKAEELARAVADRDAAARALVQSNARLALLSDTANRLLTGQRPHELLDELFQRLTGHLDLDLYAYRSIDDDGASLTLRAFGGFDAEQATRFSTMRVDEGVLARVGESRLRFIIDADNPSRDAPDHLSENGITACVWFPLTADDRLIGTLAFGTRRRPRFSLEELAVLQLVADQIAIALERERLMTELQARNIELGEADRRKDEFLAMLAHELRNPLAPIVNALHVVGLDAATRGESVARAHATMDRQVRHLIRLVDDLLDVSRITQGKIELRREVTDLQSVVEQALQIARPLVSSRQHELVVEIPAEPIVVSVDVTRMTQVLANLVNNAAKYTNVRGTITLAVEVDEDEVVVRVRDTGIGIQPEMLPRVFELFVQGEHTSDRAAGGLGIGLTLVKRLVQMHGGDVLAFSDGSGRGSEFVITIPLADSQQLTADSSAPSTVGRELSAVSSKRPLRILVVDDNADIRETLKELLEIEGHEVTVVCDGHAAIAAAGNGHQHDVAIVDIGLPGIDGYGVAAKLKDIRKEKGYPRRLIAMTGYGQAEDRRRALAAGFDAHLVKPVDPELLTRLIAQPHEGDR